ncbi:uncharacterized protein LOC123321453 [Coccinella septempunctata]|uniref:uncharacterized protein LOC123321453 n=1 Tax=Coccinella septempunctata TaxID=41139 RepID=UPI001D05E318|nr:uncharacterized protein LOC123321453 [Coccinella septempunctata]
MFLFLSLASLFAYATAGNINTPNIVNNSLVEEDEESYYPFENWSDPFDWQLLKEFADPKYKNVIISPISLKILLGLLYEGSSGSTEKEFQNVLKFSAQKRVVGENFFEILEALQPAERKDYVLNLGTRIFMDSSINPQAQFAIRAKQNYQTDIKLLDFTNGSASACSINDWVSTVTNGKIPSLVTEDELGGEIMLLINALYFKGSWRHEFPKNRTENGGFYVSPTEVVNVPLMKTTNKFFYFESTSLDAKILRLPYKGSKYAMFLVLPNSKGGLNTLLKNINLDTLKQNLYYMDYVPVDVTLPKLNFDFKVKLTRILQEFGLRQMFQNTASFPGIAKGEKNNLRMLYVSDILQKSGIRFDEEGSSVYSATDVQVINKFGEVDNVFNATHPFMFFIEEQKRGTILFAGKVENPLHLDTLTSRGGAPDKEQNKVLNTSLSIGQVLNLEPLDSSASSTIVKRFNFFDLELLKEFSDLDENVFVSPASIKTTLSMILEGAKGKCAQEIGNALRIDDIDNVEIRKQLNKLLKDLNEKTGNNKLTTANAVFVSDKLNIVTDYQMKVAQHYNAIIKPINFSNPLKAIDEINQWVKNATEGSIDTIIGDNLFEESTLVIANALYFKGKWKVSFDKKMTSMRCFTVANVGCRMVPMMQKADTLNYNLISDLNAHAVEIPYEDDKYSMLLLIPTVGTNVRILASDMQHAHFENIIGSLISTEMILEMPKFEIESELSLIEYLRPLKIREIFGSKANLTGIVNSNVRIGNIVHKARVEVNEEGTKAAAVTSAVVIPLMGDTTLKVSADKPFIFFIYQKESRNIIFEGIVHEPKFCKEEIIPQVAQNRKFAPIFRNRNVLQPSKTRNNYSYR